MSDAPTPDDRALLAKAITQDIFAGGALSEPAEVAAPERYELVRRIGQGGFGVVWLASDRTLERPVALKVLASASPADVERLRREARFTARLESDHIVSVYDLGELEGQAYIAMQYVDGGNLAQATLSHEALVRTVATVARALHVAHQEGIVHRDVKPENILLDKAGRPYLTDFGIARDLRSQDQKTHDGLVVGTPALMSPEQARGEPRSVDARTDVYCLGATLYSLLTRRPPFAGASTVDVLHAVIHAAPEPPRALAATIPAALEAIVLRCLEKEKRARYQTMLELAGDLEASLSVPTGHPERGLAPQARPRVEGPAKRSADPDWSGALEAAAEIAWWDTNRYRVTRDLPKTYPRLDALKDRLDRVLAERPDAGWARFYRGVALARRGHLEEALEDMERSIASLSDLASAHFELGRLYLELSLREHEHAHRHLSVVGGEHERHAARSRLEQAAVAFREAERLHEGLPRWQIESASAVARLAERDFEGCIRACEAILAREPEAEDVWKLKGDAERRAGREPFASYDRALEIRRSFLEALSAKAEAHLERGSLEKARECLARALEVSSEQPGVHVLLARTFLAEGGEPALQEALRQASRAVEQAPHLHGALLVKAEVEVALEGAARTGSWAERALATLEQASEAHGCQNRTLIVRARALLERARTRLAKGEDASADLAEVERVATGESANIPERHWHDILAEVAALRR